MGPGNRAAAAAAPVQETVGIVLGLVVQGAQAVNPLDLAQHMPPLRNPSLALPGLYSSALPRAHWPGNARLRGIRSLGRSLGHTRLNQNHRRRGWRGRGARENIGVR